VAISRELERFEELRVWSEYERVSIKPVDMNRRVARSIADVLLFNVPFRLRGAAEKFITSLL
jgi:hypothetical protein